ncbi:hypothetical protein H4Q32_026077 [Labeo rohita]|uniref:Reverse transcriptase domain-containing protein n=1 Tax=Labeo rohita TaxID=84645 RepID=A0ABQ8L039_LABRO|nr:hypothetical protein H4Q32_026077 [Labeo rohita]
MSGRPHLGCYDDRVNLMKGGNSLTDFLSHKCFRQNPMTGRASDKDIEINCMKWLLLSGERDGGRKERMNKQQCNSSLLNTSLLNTQFTDALLKLLITGTFSCSFDSRLVLSILGLTETWIRPEDSATPAALSTNFSFSHTPRHTGRGGVTAPIKLHVVVIYRPPGQLGTFLEELDGLLSSFQEDGTPLLVFGDFNKHLDKPYAADFHSLLASFDFKRLVTTSTHKSGNQLDLIYTRSCVADNTLVKPLHISDHFFITLSSSLPSTTRFSSLDVNAATDTLCSTLTSCLDDMCPLSSKPARAAPPNPWLSDVLREHGSKLRAAERKWRKSKHPSDLSMYKCLLSSFSAQVHTAKSSYFHNKINNAPDTRKLFKTFNSLLCPPTPPPTTSKTANVFATFFTDKTTTISSQFSAPHVGELIPTTSTANTPVFSFCPLSEAEVSKLLLSSHPTTCPLDPIPSHLLHAISPTLLPALTHIINTSLLTGTFPTAFKQARVTPLLKKTTLNSSLIDNYRPISLLPFIPKTLKRVIFNQVSLFLAQNSLLDANQSGFRSGHSTETTLLSVTEALRIAKADSRSSVLILLDLSAAFDTVNHQILLSTLSSLGITGIPLRWFESYLTGRSFRVAWGGEVSKAHHLVTGVPQGSVLGPLLFSIYTTSLGLIIQAHGFSYHCYADDTQLYLSFQPDDPTVAARISGCLADISEWMKEHHLQLNLAKTELLVFPATLQNDFTIHLGTLTITPSSSARNLGVIFDNQLTFKDHIAKTARSCRFALHNIRKIRPFLTEQATQLLVQALVISRLDYCNALLAGLPSCTIKPLQMIQNAAARLVFNEPKRAYVTPLFITLHWLPVAARIKFKTLMLAYRTATGSAPGYLHSLLPIYTPSRTLRSSKNLLSLLTQKTVCMESEMKAMRSSVAAMYELYSRALGDGTGQRAEEIRLDVCGTIDELLSLEEKLKETHSGREWYTSFKPVGGPNPVENTRRVMQAVSSYNDWKEFSLKGKKGKRESMIVIKVIKKAVMRSNPGLQQTKVKDIVADTLKLQQGVRM